MPLANLHELHGAVCELAGLAPGRARSAQSRSLSLRLGGVIVTMMDAGPGAVLLILELGTMPDEGAKAGWLALLDGNAFMMDVDAPRFSRNPANGEVVLHRICRLESVTATEAFELIARMAALATAWRADHTLADAHGSAAHWDPPRAIAYPLDDPLVLRAVSNFRGLHEGMCALLGQPAATGVIGGDEKFELRLAAFPLPVTVGHAASTRPGVAFACIRLGAPSDDRAIERSTQLMESNFALMMDPAAMTFCRDAGSGDFLLMFAHRLTGSDARSFLGRLVAVLAVARALCDLPG